MRNLTYKEAGVDIDAGYEVVKRVKKLARSVKSKQMLGGIGGFGGAYALKGLGYKNPVLVSAVDGVGTKLKLAFLTGIHDTIGIDLVAMNVDDVIACGAKPLFFLDYIACHRVQPNVIEKILKGVVEGCKQANCALIGGETAEMNDLYAPGEYDLAGFCVGAVEKKDIIDTSKIKPGDKIIGLISSGLHSNGYSLARKVFFDYGKMSHRSYLSELKNPIGVELLKPTKIYAPIIQKLLKSVKIKGIAHITGGGLPENVGRIIPKGAKAFIESKSWSVPAIFQIIQSFGRIAKPEMFKTFNMGIGMAIVVAAKDVNKTLNLIKKHKEKAYLIGGIAKGKSEVTIV